MISTVRYFLALLALAPGFTNALPTEYDYHLASHSSKWPTADSAHFDKAFFRQAANDVLLSKPIFPSTRQLPATRDRPSAMERPEHNKRTPSRNADVVWYLSADSRLC